MIGGGVAEHRKFSPLSDGHCLIGQQCPCCGKLFAVGDETTLIPIGAPPDRVETVEAQPVHWACYDRLRQRLNMVGQLEQLFGAAFRGVFPDTQQTCEPIERLNPESWEVLEAQDGGWFTVAGRVIDPETRAPFVPAAWDIIALEVGANTSEGIEARLVHTQWVYGSFLCRRVGRMRLLIIEPQRE